MFWWMLRYVEEEQKQAQKKAERVLFELNVDEMTLANVAKKFQSRKQERDAIIFILDAIEGLETLKEGYWERGMKRMKNVAIKTINMLKRELRELQLQNKTVAEFLIPLMARDNQNITLFEGLEVKNKKTMEGDVSVIVRVENTTHATVRTLNRKRMTERTTDLHDLDIVVRQSRAFYASLIHETPYLRDEPVISRTISDFLYFRLIPIEINLPGGISIACQPPHFPVTWTLARVLDAQLPGWEKRYFKSKYTSVPPLSSTPHLVAVNDFYLQAMVKGKKKFDFILTEDPADDDIQTNNFVGSLLTNFREVYQSQDVSPLKATEPSKWNNAFPYFSKEDERFFELNHSMMLKAPIPDAGLERLVDRYVERIRDRFPFKALYVSATAVSSYRNLCMRIAGEHGKFRGTLEMLQRGHSWTGDRKLSACQYVVQSNQLEIFHKNKPPPLVSQCLEDPSILEEVINLYPETTGKTIQTMKDRKVWHPIYANLTGCDCVEEEELQSWDSASATMQSMFEIYAYYGLNYIGAPIRSKSNDHPLGVVCLLHDNDHNTADQWEELSDIKTLANEIQTLFQNIKIPSKKQIVRNRKGKK